MAIYQRFLSGVPEYLARHYWWAYLWRWGIWFFDHQPIINAILFGQYKKLMHKTLSRYQPAPGSRTLQLTCVYGSLTPNLATRSEGPLHIMDACMAQLHLAQRKCARPVLSARMNAESLAYADDSFDHVILFFLLHEMPPDARKRTLAEMLRVVRPGATVLITEYGALPTHHWLCLLPPTRWILGRLEPFLPGFWQEDLDGILRQAAERHGKVVRAVGEPASIFSGFYRVVEYRVSADEADPIRPVDR